MYKKSPQIKSNNSRVKISKVLISSLIIAIVLSPILFLMELSIKYLIYVMAFSLTGLFVLFSLKSEYQIKISLPNFSKIVDYFLITCSIIVFVSILLDNTIVELTFPFSIVLSFFLPGWVLLRWLEIDRTSILKIGLIVLGFAISIGLTSIIFFFGLHLIPPAFLSAIYLVLSFLPFLKDRLFKSKTKKELTYLKNKNNYNLFDILIISWIIIFFVFVVMNVYPEIANVPGQDITRHFTQSQQLIVTPDIYGSVYPWFHLTGASINIFSAPSYELFNIGIPFLSLILIFSFYIMSREYLSDLDKRAHLFATAFFSVFAGFGWLHFIQQKLTLGASADYFNLLFATRFASFFDIHTGGSVLLWIWFRPITIGMIIFFVILYLMKNKNLSKRNYLILCTLLILTVSQIHFAEIFILTILLFVLAILRPSLNLRLKQTFISVFLGLIISATFYIIFQNNFNSDYQPISFVFLSFAAILAASGYLLVLFPRRPKISFKLNARYVASIILFVYFILLFYWFTNSENYTFSDFTKILPVPPEFYPMLIGVVGFFAILGSIVILKNHKNHEMIIFVILLVSAIILGRTITFFNINVIETNYWERRLIPFVFLSACMLAPLPLLKIVNYNFNQSFLKGFKNLWKITFLSFLVLGGTFSTFLSVEEQILFNKNKSLTENEIKAQSILKTFSPESTLLTVSKRSGDVSLYTAFTQIVDSNRYELWSSKSPEFSLDILSSPDSSTVVYLSDDDQKTILKNYQEGYLANHLLKIAPIIDSHPDRKILNIPKMSPTSTNSDMVLVLSENQTNSYYAYEILSLGGYNYTVAYLNDINSIKNAKIIISPSEDIANKLLIFKNNYDLKFLKIFVLNIDGSANLVNLDGSVSTKGNIESDIAINEKNLQQNAKKAYELARKAIDKYTKPNQETSIAITENARKSKGILENSDSLESKVLEKGNETIRVDNLLKSSAIMIQNKTIIQFPSQIELYNNFFKEDFEVIAYYEPQRPFILQKAFPEFDMYYIDTYPIIQKINSGDQDARNIFPYLGKLLGLIDSNLPSFETTKRNQFRHVNEDYFTYREASLFGDLLVKSVSPIISTNASSINVSVDGNEMIFYSVKQILPINIESSTIKSDQGVIRDGFSFYSNIFMDSAYVILTGNPAVISLVSIDGSTEIIHGKEIQLNLTTTDMLLRQPTISTNGITKFIEFYGHGQIDKIVRMNGLKHSPTFQDLQIDGNVTFTNKYADVLSFANDALFEGSMNSSKSIYPYDELSSLIALSYSNINFVFALGLSIVLINVIITYKIRK